MDKKTAKLSSVTHEYVQNKQTPNETMDETLQRLLGIGSNPDDLTQTVAAYLSDETRADIEEVINHIEGLGPFKKQYTSESGPGGDDLIRFMDPSSGIALGQVKMGENGYTIEYRNADGDMDAVDNGVVPESSNKETDIEELKETTTEAIESARRRWGK